MRQAAMAAGSAILTRTMQGKIMSDLRFLKSIVNAEKNYYDATASLNPAVTPAGQCITAPPEGDDVANRTGRSIKSAGIDVRVQVLSATAATTPQFVRCLLVKDNDPAGVAPSIAAILTSSSVNSPLALDNDQERFSLLYDRTFVLPLISGGDGGLVIDMSIPISHHIFFVGTAAGASSAGKGNLFLYLMADQVATNISTGLYYSRLRYYDN